MFPLMVTLTILDTTADAPPPIAASSHDPNPPGARLRTGRHVTAHPVAPHDDRANLGVSVDWGAKNIVTGKDAGICDVASYRQLGDGQVFGKTARRDNDRSGGAAAEDMHDSNRAKRIAGPDRAAQAAGAALDRPTDAQAGNLAVGHDRSGRPPTAAQDAFVNVDRADIAGSSVDAATGVSHPTLQATGNVDRADIAIGVDGATKKSRAANHETGHLDTRQVAECCRDAPRTLPASPGQGAADRHWTKPSLADDAP